MSVPQNVKVAAITAFTTLIVSFTGAYFTFQDQSARSQIAFTEQILKRLREVEQTNLDCQTEINKLRSELQREFNHGAVLESFYEYAPIPVWFKDTTSRMYFINRSYEREWGVPQMKYRGATDYEVWPKAVADAFKENDRQVIESRKGFITTEMVPNDPENPTKVREWVIYKFPVYKDGEIIGVGGIASHKLPE